MGNVTKEFGIWTPDEENGAEPDVYLSQMADSLEAGMGKRVLKQEQKAFIRTEIERVTTLPADHTLLRLPIYATLRQGININGGIIDIVSDGLYFCAPTVETDFAPNMPLDVVFRVNGGSTENPHTVASDKSFTTVVMPTILPLYKGDKLWLEARVGDPMRAFSEGIKVRKARLHLAMIYAF